MKSPIMPCLDMKASTICPIEYCFLGLRTAAGIDKKLFQQKFGVDLFTVYGRTIEKLVAQDLLQHTDRGIALTTLGMKYGNQVFGEFLL